MPKKITATPGNNGQSDQQVPDKLQGFLDLGSFDSAFTSPHIASAIEKFVERGEKVEDLLLRGHFRDANHMNSLVRLYRKAVHFHDAELQQLLLNHAAGYPAIGGLRIDILLKAVIGQYNIEKQKGFSHSLRSALGLNGKGKAGDQQ